MAINARSIVRQLLTLSSDPESQVFIVREEGCLKGLVGYLKSIDNDVKLMAAQSIQLLSSHPDNKDRMAVFYDLKDNLLLHVDSPVEKLRGCVRDALMNIGDYSFLNRDIDDDNDVVNSTRGRAHENQPASEKKYIHKKRRLPVMKTFTIKVDGLHIIRTRQKVERALISVKGVISVTLDMKMEHALVCTRETPEIIPTLEKAIEAAGVSLSGNNEDKSIRKPRSLFQQMREGKESTGGAAEFKGGDDDGYLDDDLGYSGFAFPSITGGGMLSKVSFLSLEAQLEAKIINDKRVMEVKLKAEQKQQSVMGSISSAFSSWW